MTDRKKRFRIEVIPPVFLNKELQESIKAGNPLILIKKPNPKTGRMEGKDGKIIWNGKNFLFFPENEIF